MVASSFLILPADFIVILINHLYFFHKNRLPNCSIDLLNYHMTKLSETLHSNVTAEMSKF